MKTSISFYLFILLSLLSGSCAKDFSDYYANNETASDNTEYSTPGVVITFSASATGNYVASPSIAILNDGTYVASHDWQNYGYTSVFQSIDRGATWEKVADVSNMHWANLFTYENTLYMMGVNRSFGDIHIRKSVDGGRTWTEPTGSSDGVLFTGGQYHTAPVPVAVHDGRIWRSFENAVGNTADRNFKTLVISASLGSDLLNAANWVATNELTYDTAWGGSEWIEGNVVVTPDNKLVNILRNNSTSGERAAMVRVEDQSTIAFDSASDFITFPGSNVKFTIRYDEISKKYWSLTNYIPAEYALVNPNLPESTRNTLALVSSSDLKNWTVNKVILQSQDVKRVGYQYADWQIDGDDIVSVLRVAETEPDGTSANNFHDANYIIFYRVANFRATGGAADPAVTFDDMEIEVYGDESASFETAPFENGTLLFTNKTYKLENVPEMLSGYEILISEASKADKGTIVPSRAGKVYIIAQPRQDNKLDDWAMISNIEFNYDDYNKSKLYVFEKNVTAGEQVSIPELDGFPGAIPLARKITYTVGAAPQPTLDFDDMEIEVYGDESVSFTPAPFENGTPLFTDKTYVLENIPEALSGYEILTSKASVADKGTSVPSRAGKVYIVAQKRTDNMLNGWSLVSNVEFNYSDYNKTKLYVFEKSVTAGEQVPIPELDGFPGASPLARKITYSVGDPAQPAPWFDDMPIQVIGDENASFTPADFQNGTLFFPNKTYKLENVPEALSGYRFLASDANVIDKGVIVPSRNGKVYIIAQPRQDNKLDGWTQVSDIEFNYDDYNKTKLYVFEKSVTAGEQVPIPELDGFPGASPLAREITYTVEDPSQSTSQVDEMSISVIGEAGATFQVKEFKNGVTIFTNRETVLENVPEAFQGFQFLSSDGNVVDKGTIRPSRDGYIYIIGENRMDPGDWTKEPDIEFNYSDANKTKLYIYKKQVTAGQEIAIPNWSGFPGASPLAKTIQYTAN